MALTLDEAGASAGSPTSEADRKLTLALPPAVVRQLRARMAAEETTIRALVLEALKASGYAVPEAEIRDRRRAARRPARRRHR
jgi:hypothetical protein